MWFGDVSLDPPRSVCFPLFGQGFISPFKAFDVEQFQVKYKHILDKNLATSISLYSYFALTDNSFVETRLDAGYAAGVGVELQMIAINSDEKREINILEHLDPQMKHTLNFEIQS